MVEKDDVPELKLNQIISPFFLIEFIFHVQLTCAQTLKAFFKIHMPILCNSLDNKK